MPIRVKCDNCKKTLSVKDQLAGKKIKCPVCQSVVAVPSTSPAPSKPIAKPASPSKKSGPGPKVATKTPPDKTKTNGAPAPGKSKSNGVPAKAPPAEPPPEHIEEAAASALADEPKPPAPENAAPTMIEFKCQWCDEDVKLPVELAGKQSQCPNPECRRIVKVPLLKAETKGDWRKMERQGPAAARVNLPEQLENAWGTEETTKARQGSLAQAGAIELPPPKPRNWVQIGLVSFGIVVLLGFGGFGLNRLRLSKGQNDALKSCKQLIDGPDAKVKHPLLVAEVHRTMGLLYFNAPVRNPANEARKQFQGAASLIEIDNPTLNEQLFLIDLALSQIELGGEGDDILANTNRKLEWKEVLPEIQNTLDKIVTPDIRVLALREVGPRLLERKQEPLAITLTASVIHAANGAGHQAPKRQEIALLCNIPSQQENLQKLGKLPDVNLKDECKDGHLRVGYAEGYARKGKEHYEMAFKIASLPGPAKDRLDAFLGVAAVAWQARDKETTARFLKEAMELINAKNDTESVTTWQLLQLARLAARVEDADTLKTAMELLPAGPFKLRAQLESFKAICDRATTAVDPEKLSDLEIADKEGATLALAWITLAQHNSRHGASRDRNRSDFDARAGNLQLPAEMVDQIRAMVDVGTFQGSMQ